MSNEFDFGDVTFAEVAVVIPGGGECVLRQASGEAAIKYRKQIMGGMRMEDGKVGGNVTSMAAGEPLLVHLCLYDVDNKRVPLTKIESWPYPVMKKLYDKAMEISDLNPDDTKDAGDWLKENHPEIFEEYEKYAEEARGNESEGTESGSS